MNAKLDLKKIIDLLAATATYIWAIIEIFKNDVKDVQGNI